MKSKITFNIFSSHYLPHIGGIEVFVENMSRELSNRGFIVNIITSNSDNNIFKKIEDRSSIYRLKSFFLLKGRFPIHYSIGQIISVYRNCFVNKETYTVINTRFFLTSLLGVILGKLSKSKIIVIEHGSGHFLYKNPIVNYLSHCYEHIITYIIMLYKPDFYGVSKACCKWLEHFNIKSCGIIYNGISFSVSFTKSILWNNQWDEKKVIFYAGRLIKEKGILELISGFKKFSINSNKFVLIIAGSGDLSSEISKSLIGSNNIFFIGKLSRNDILYFLSKTAVYVNPSNYPEGLPTVILEAGLFSIPVVSTLNGGAKEIIFDKKTGVVIPSGSISNIYNSLIWISKNYNQAVKIGSNLNFFLREKFDWQIIINKFLSKLNLNEKN